MLNTTCKLTFIIILISTFSLSSHAQSPDYTISLHTPLNAPKDKHWMQVRPGAIPQPNNKPPRVVVIMQLTDNVGTHMYHGLASFHTNDLGQSWSKPITHNSLQRITHPNKLIEVPVDATLTYHKNTNKLLLTGATFWLDAKIKRDTPNGPSDTAYAVYDQNTDSWSKWAKLQMPPGKKFRYARAGCTQPVVEPDGTILLPIYFGEHNNSIHYTTVVRCSFDGQTLKYITHGNEMKVDFGRGFSEPSLTKFNNKYYMTIRNDKRGYITTSTDGLNFEKPISWKFDDNSDLGSYNTQQHFATHSHGLFLVYTRRGLNNDNVMRHRAPLVMAQINPKTLRVIKSTERIIIPKVGDSRFGNFGVNNISPDQTWITAGRGKALENQPSVYIAKIKWKTPNNLMK